MYAIAWEFPPAYSGKDVPLVFTDRFDTFDAAVKVAETCYRDLDDDCYRVGYQVIFLDGENED